jgi:ELWxxDGT repeat protein
MIPPTRFPRSVLPFRVLSPEPLEPRLLLAVGPAYLVKDVNAVTAPSAPFSFVAFKDATYFRADDGGHGIEWFRSDGTAAGTSLFTDLNPGPGSSFGGLGSGADRDVPTAAVLGDALYFTAFTPAAGTELMKTDGTAAGTVVVKDIRPAGSSSPQRFLVVGNTLYFTADDGTHGRQIWKTDGTEGGTQRVSDIPNTDASMVPLPLGAVGGKLVFAARQAESSSSAGRELYITDGTPAGTTLLKNINPSGGSYPGLTGNGNPTAAVVNNMLYFPATDSLHGRELWRTDGTPDGTVLVAELAPGTGSSSPTNLTEVNRNLYFTAQFDGFDTAVYRRDPTGVISEIPAPGAFPQISHITSPASAGNVGGVFYVAGGLNNEVALFKHDPASNSPIRGLTFVKGLSSNTAFNPNAGPILDFNGKALLLVPGPSGSKTIHLWQSDGTTAGTVDLATFLDPQIDDHDVYARWHPARGAGGLVYFAGATPATGTEPVRTDGTEAGTFVVKDLNTNTLSSDPSQTVYLGGSRWVFTATEPEHGKELWVTNGTAAGTYLLKDIYPGTRSSFRSLPVALSPALNGRTYFAAVSSGEDIDTELWTTDGTPAGTYRLKPTSGNFSSRNFAVLNGKMYFTAHGGLWETDGTEAGTRVVQALDRITFGPLVRIGDELYFATHRADVGSELWKSDGTAAGTQLVRAFGPGTTTLASPPVAMDGTVYFTGPTDAGGQALWRSDGTPAGTSVVKELPGRYAHLQTVGHRLLLSRGELGQQVESDILVSDGTAAGTVPLASLVPELEGFKGEDRALGDVQMTVVGGAAYFFGRTATGDTGPAVWRTDGTAAGTRRLHTFPAAAKLLADNVVDGLVYFSTGTQLWRTDGTDAGTVLVHDATSGNVGGGGRLTFFSASDPAHGTELWALPRDVTEVYVRGSAWAPEFKTYLLDKGLGDDVFGYRIEDAGAAQVLPWVNLNEFVIRFAGDMSNRGVPTPATVSLQSQRGAAPPYSVVRVDPVSGDPNAFVFVLDRPLGGDGADPSRNGDRLTMTVAGAGPLDAPLSVRLNVLQGDVDSSSTVVADDFSAVKKKFFRSATAPGDSADPSANYSPFHDVDGSGAILAADYAAVKQRFFHRLPAATTTATAAAATRTRPVTRALFGSTPVLQT